MRTYLVTGGAGFIGSNYIHYMFRKYDNEIRIINVDVLTYAGNLENLKDIENRDNYTLRLTRNSFMYLLMKYMVHYRMMIMPFSMRHHLSILIAHIRQARHPLI